MSPPASPATLLTVMTLCLMSYLAALGVGAVCQGLLR